MCYSIKHLRNAKGCGELNSDKGNVHNFINYSLFGLRELVMGKNNVFLEENHSICL